MSLLNSASKIYLGATPVDAMHANGVRVWPPAVAVAEDFFTGDGVTQQTRLQLAGRSVTNPTVTAMHQTDWQGRQLLYPTARTNLALYSSDPTNSAWKIHECTPLASGVGPDGSTPATLVVPTTSNVYHYIYPGATLVAGAASVTYFAKAAGYDYAQIEFYDGSTDGGFRESIVSLIDGSVALQASGVVLSNAVLANGWIKIVVSGTVLAPAGNIPRFTLFPSPHSTNVGQFSGDGVSGILFGGVQISQSTQQGVYIPTTAAPVTVTDYTVDSSGNVTLGQIPVAGATLDWDGTGLLVD